MLDDAAEPTSRAPMARPIAAGRGWAINDVVCRLGPQDRSEEERFDSATIAVVLDGLFECRSSAGTALLYPGAFFLGNAGTCFECGHDHGVGDRCVAFHFDAALFEEIAATAAGSHRFRFPIAMLPSGANLAPSIVEALLHASGESLAKADETAIATADIVIRTVSGLADAPPSPMPRERSRLIRAIDYLEEHGDEAISLDDLCVVACMSKYHFLRCFRALTGMTPHQYLIALRLRRAATALRTTSEPVAAIAFEVGFGDLSTFNARFRTAFGASPQRFRRRPMVLPRRSECAPE